MERHSLKDLEEMDVHPYSSSVPVGRIYDQLDSGQCGGCAGAYQLHEKEYLKGNDIYPSHTYIYGSDNERYADGMYFDVLVVKLMNGVPLENEFDSDFFNKEKSRMLVREHKNEYKRDYKVNGYKYLYTWKQVLNAIREYNGCILSVDVYENWKTDENGIIGKSKGKLIGRHLIFCKDYEQLDDGSYRIRFVNSWGENWGDNGCGYLNNWIHSFHNAVAFY